jgi:hypothetical protein
MAQMDIPRPVSHSLSFWRIAGAQIFSLVVLGLAVYLVGYLFSFHAQPWIDPPITLSGWLYPDSSFRTPARWFVYMGLYAVYAWILLLFPGAVLSLAQWLLLRRWLRRVDPWSWILYSALAFMILSILSVLLYSRIPFPHLSYGIPQVIPPDGVYRLMNVALASRTLVGLLIGFLLGLSFGLFQSLWLQTRKRTWWGITAVVWALLVAGFSLLQ